MSTDPAAEAAFELWLNEHPPGTANVHTAFLAGRASKGENVNHELTQGRIVRYYPNGSAYGYPALVTRTFGTAEHPVTYCNLTVFIDGVNGLQDGFTEEECARGTRLAYSVVYEGHVGLDPRDHRWGWPPRK